MLIGSIIFSNRPSPFDERRSVGSPKHRASRQRPQSRTETNRDDRNRQAPDEYYEEPQRTAPRRTQSEADSEASDSDIFEETDQQDNLNASYSDNDVIQRRARRFREKRYLDDWDNRSVKSVAF